MSDGQARTDDGGSNGHSRGEPGPLRHQPSASVVVFPTIPENCQLSELRNNLEETEAHLERLRRDREALAATYEETQSLLRKEHEALHAALDRRESESAGELSQRFQERDDKIAAELAALEAHRAENQGTRDECQGLIVGMPERAQRRAREALIKEKTEACIAGSPEVQAVPIALEFAFGTRKRTVAGLESYGALRCAALSTGQRLPFTTLGYVIDRRPGLVGGGVQDRDVPLPALGLARVKHDRGDDSLAWVVTIKDADLAQAASAMDMKDDDQQHALRDGYDRVKKEKTYLQTQCVGSQDKKCHSFEDGRFDVVSCDLLSKLAIIANGKYSLAIPSAQFEVGTTVHGRARLVHLTDASAIDDGHLAEESIVRSTPWSKPTKVNFGKGAVAPIVRQAGENGGEVAGSVRAGAANDEKECVDAAAAVSAPERLKVKCDITLLGGQTLKRTLIMKASVAPVCFETLVAMVRSKSKSEDGQFVLKVGDSVVSNENDFAEYCIVPKMDVVTMTATMVE